ncbi:MAG: DEAD/DEAH box helicase [Desulfovibrionaceae bacterium]|nr:DEAD/DEAH box helicase [Desulfovibrionaceae bacterium]
MMTEFSPIVLHPPELLIHAVSDGRRLGLQLHNVPGMGRELTRAGAWWIAGRRMWAIDLADADQCLKWLGTMYAGQHVDLDGARPVLAAALAAPEPGFFTQLFDVQVFPLVKGDLARGDHAVSFTYDAPCVRAMRALRGYFHKPASAWQVRGAAGRILDALRDIAGVASEFVFVHEQPVVLEDFVSQASDASPIKVPAASPERSQTSPDNEGVGFLSAELDQNRWFALDEQALAAEGARAGLRDYQFVGVRHLMSQSGACLADDMGLGKSRQMVVAARLAAGQGRVLILCPASLRINWEREIRMVYPGAVVGMAGEDRIATLYGCQWVVANYERLGGLVREPDLSFAVLAVDEAHYLKEHQSGRTRNAFVMATRIPRRYVMTGTPLLNREIEMHTLLRLTGHALGRMPLKDFSKRYAGSGDKRAQLAAALKGWMLRRHKDVLDDLGQKIRQVRWVSPAEGLGAYKEIYRDMTLQAMPKITKLRQRLEALKTPFLIEMVESLSEGDKIIIFCEYMATVQAMKSAFDTASIHCVTLVGADSPQKRQRAIDAFQSEPAVSVFIGTTSAAGVGITLTAANHVAFASLPWTPALMRQAEDRAYRLGQKRNVLVIVPLVAGTIDEGIWRLLEAKQETERDVIEAAVTAELPCAQSMFFAAKQQ